MPLELSVEIASLSFCIVSHGFRKNTFFRTADSFYGASKNEKLFRYRNFLYILVELDEKLGNKVGFFDYLKD